MTAKEVKAYLNEYRKCVKRSKAAQDHLNELRAMAERITPNYAATGGGSCGVSDRLGAAVAKIIDAEAVVDAEIELLIATERDIQNAIDKVNDETLRTLLYERYINGKTWEQIAVQMNYGYRRVTQLHGKALNAVKDFLEFPT